MGRIQGGEASFSGTDEIMSEQSGAKEGIITFLGEMVFHVKRQRRGVENWWRMCRREDNLRRKKPPPEL